MIERIEINLLPAEYRIHTRRIVLKREIIYPAIIVIIMLCSLAVWTWDLDAEINKFTEMIIDTKDKIARNQSILDEINSLKEQKRIIQNKIRALERIDVNREKWIRLQEIFSQKLPEGTWIDRIDEKGDTLRVQGEVISLLEVEGRTFSFSEVALYMSRLTESENIRNVELVNIEQIDGKQKVFRFMIICSVNAEIKLKNVDGE